MARLRSARPRRALLKCVSVAGGLRWNSGRPRASLRAVADSKPVVERILRSLAVGSSIALAALVIVRAQAGCDAPPDRATPSPAAEPERTPAAPTPAKPPAAAPDPPAEPEPVKEPPIADTKVEAKAELAAPAPNVTPKAPKPKPPDKEEKKFFPASKSGIDFGHRNEPAPSQQQANPAPQ